MTFNSVGKLSTGENESFLIGGELKTLFKPWKESHPYLTITEVIIY